MLEREGGVSGQFTYCGNRPNRHSLGWEETEQKKVVIKTNEILLCNAEAPDRISGIAK